MTANDSDVSDGDILTGSQVVRVYGENLTAPFVTLTFGDVEYIPLAQGEGYIEFTLGDNGTAIIAVDGNRFMSFEIEDAVIPEWLPADFTMAQFDNSSSSYSGGINILVLNADCVNYPHLYNDDYPYFGLVINPKGSATINLSDLTLHNCIAVHNFFYNGSLYLKLSPVDNDKPCWVVADNFIFAVFNYTTD